MARFTLNDSSRFDQQSETNENIQQSPEEEDLNNRKEGVREKYSSEEGLEESGVSLELVGNVEDKLEELGISINNEGIVVGPKTLPFDIDTTNSVRVNVYQDEVNIIIHNKNWSFNYVSISENSFKVDKKEFDFGWGETYSDIRADMIFKSLAKETVNNSLEPYTDRTESREVLSSELIQDLLDSYGNLVTNTVRGEQLEPNQIAVNTELKWGRRFKIRWEPMIFEFNSNYNSFFPVNYTDKDPMSVRAFKNFIKPL